MTSNNNNLKTAYNSIIRGGNMKTDGKLTYELFKRWFARSTVAQSVNFNQNVVTTVFNRYKSDAITYEQFSDIIFDIAKSLSITSDELVISLVRSSGGHIVADVHPTNILEHPKKEDLNLECEACKGKQDNE